MSHKTYRINTKINSGEKVLKVNLKQGIDTFNVLSLEINSEDTYQLHTSNYGVIVGRVLANDAFGVPNVKVSVFIPISDDDQNSYVVSNEYPYKTTQSVNNDGVKYNLLYDEAFAGLDGKHKSIGTFPNKRLVLDNDGQIEVFEKYWKYTTTTNEAGDYMIFGVPTGTCQVHYDCDLSDIGIISQRPYDFINKGYSAQLFKSATEFNDDMADSAVQVLKQDKTIFVYPFWGDKNANEIGITRNDINLDYKFEPSCIFMGSSITDAYGSYIGVYGMPNGNNGRFKSLVTSSGDIEVIRQTQNGNVEELTDNVTGIINGNGVWCYAIPMNLDRIGTDEEGNIVPISNPNKGIPTRARVRFRISLTDTIDASNSEYTAKILVPCNPKLKRGYIGMPQRDMPDDEYESIYEFGSKTPDSCFRDLYWGKVYSIKQYYPRLQYGDKPIYQVERSGVNYADYPVQYSSPFSCISSIDSIAGFNPFPYNTMYSGAENMNDNETKNWFIYHLTDNASNSDYPSKGLHFCFENDWINGCLYFPRVKIEKKNDGKYQYFGWANKNEDNQPSDTYITGRHNLKYVNGKYTIRDTASDKWSRWNNPWYNSDIDNTSCFSYIIMSGGLLTQKQTMYGEDVFYYKCGDANPHDWGQEGAQTTQYVRLYATDIILLGNMSDIYDSLPKLFEKLPSTTTIFPPLVIPKTLNESGMNQNCYEAQLNTMYHTTGHNTDDVDIFGNWVAGISADGTKCSGQGFTYLKKPDGSNGDLKHYKENTLEAYALYLRARDSCPHTFYTNSAEEHIMNTYYFHICRFLEERSTLFFGYRVYGCQDFLCYFRKSFPNMSRICELDVNNDSAFVNLDAQYIPVNGVIDRFDISSDDTRSLFASMNHNITRSITDPITGYKKYVPTVMNMVDFEGRLSNYFVMYDTHIYDEDVDKSYIKFRFNDNGNGPMVYHAATMPTYYYENQEPLILTENSFYFYFGLHGGNSAIDVFKSKYYATFSEKNMSVNLLSVKNGDYTYCINEKVYRCIHITINEALTAPYECYIYSGNDIVKKEVSNTRNICFKLPIGIYKLQVIDSKNRIVEKVISLNGVSIDVEYELNAEEYTCLFKKINGHEISRYNAQSDKKLDITNSVEDNTYHFEFDKPYSGNTSATDSICKINFASGETTIQATVYLNECDKRTLLISFAGLASTAKNFSGVPIEVIKPWKTPSNGKYEWKSKHTASANFGQLDYSGNLATKYSNLQKIEQLSNMIGCVYDESNMFIDGSPNKYDKCTISPNTSSVVANITNPKKMWEGCIEYSDNTSRIFGSLGSADRNDEFPYIVGQNYPIDLHKQSTIKIKRGGNYGENDALKVKDGSNKEYIGYNYFGFADNTNHLKDLPSNLLPTYNTNVLTSVKNDDIKNYFQIQTVDKRFDYEGVLLTPLILPSGYNSFNNLTYKALIGGKTKTTIYGGLRFDHNTVNTITCYEEYGNTISGNPTSNASLYNETVYEDTNTQNTITSNNVTITKKHIWDLNKNDEVLIQHTNDLLSGNTCFGVDFIGCSSDLSNWSVKMGKGLSLVIPYSSGVELIHTTISDDDYDILYEQSSSGSTTYYGSLSGTSLSFKIAGTSLYNGNSYTDIDIDSYKKDKTSTNGTNLTYPSWAQEYVNEFGSVKTRELSLLRCTSANLSAITEYSVKISNVDKSKYSTVAYNKSKYFMPYYIDDNGDEQILTDNELNSIYTFKVDSSTDKFGDFDYLIIPTRKLYKANDYTLLKQEMVYNVGCAFYAGKLNINIEGNEIKVQLNSPLLKDGKVDYNSATKLSDGKYLHTIGDIDAYYSPDNNVTYDDETLTFTITTIQTSGVVEFYFMMTNGLKYKVNIKLD